jgi:large subunit ribosomal protein L22
MESVAVLKNCPLSPRKMRLVVDQIRGQKVDKALSILQFSQRKYYAQYVEKLLKSAISNWEQKNQGSKSDESNVIVSAVFVDGAVVAKRMRTAPQGRAYRIRKRFSHVTIKVDSINKVENQKAEADVNKAISIMKTQERPDVSSLYTLITISSNFESEKEIYDLVDRAINNSPESSKDNLLLYLVRGNIRLFQKNTEGALEAFDNVISLNPEFPVAYYLRVLSRSDTSEDLTKSLEDLNKAIKLSPNFAQAYLARGYLYWKLKNPVQSQVDFNQAIAIYKEVIKKNPNSIDAYARRRRIYSRLGDTQQAESDLLKIVKLRGKQKIKYAVSQCDNQQLLASFRDLLSCQ